MATVVLHEEHTRAWHAFLVEQKPMNWKALFSDYEATVDAPAAFFYREILDAFPEAKVLLNLRDPESWYRSYMTLRGTSEELRSHRSVNARLDMWLRIVDAIEHHVFDGRSDRDTCVAAFDAHNRRVEAEIPKDRLLTFRVQEGWVPLCEFLGREVPDEPFPHLNEGAETVRTALSLTFGVT